MKRLAIYNLLFGKVFGLVSLFGFLLLPLNASAATFSCVSKPVVKKDGTFLYRVEVKIKGDGVTKIDVRLKDNPALTGSTGVPYATTPTTSGTNFTFSINSTSYAQGTALDLYAHKTTGEFIEKISGCSFPWKISSTAPIATPPQTPLLPVEFVKSSTVLGSNAITITVRNKGTKNFEVTVSANDASTQRNVESKGPVNISAGAETKIFFNQGVTNGNTYNLVMTGTQQGVSTTYQSVSYSGIVVPTNTTGSGGGVTATGGAGAGGTTTPNTTTTGTTGGNATCNDGKDNSDPLNGKADYYGVDIDNDGKLDLEPDPSCISLEGAEGSDEPAGQLLSCYNYCTFSDVLKTINNFITFLITTLFVPTIVLLFMLAGFKYLAAQGNPTKVANLKKMLRNIVIGMILILCSWLIVKVLLTTIVRDDDSALQFLE